jgi:hypothetical protein
MQESNMAFSGGAVAVSAIDLPHRCLQPALPNCLPACCLPARLPGCLPQLRWTDATFPMRMQVVGSNFRTIQSIPVTPAALAGAIQIANNQALSGVSACFISFVFVNCSPDASAGGAGAQPRPGTVRGERTFWVFIIITFWVIIIIIIIIIMGFYYYYILVYYYYYILGYYYYYYYYGFLLLLHFGLLLLFFFTLHFGFLLLFVFCVILL